MDMLRLFTTLALCSGAAGLVSPGDTGRLPAMGWNSWNTYACNVNEDVILTVGQKLVSLGLKDAGYQYVNIDDCWSDKQRRRDASTKEIIPDATKFPRGISHTADAIHALGLKLGIYSDAGTDTCGGYAGSLGYEDIDAATFSKWGVDYLKYDNCNVPSQYNDAYSYSPGSPSTNAPRGYDWGTSNTAKRFKAMRDAILKQSRTMQFSLCVWGQAHVELWGNSTGHSWRMWGDIEAKWDGHDNYSWGLMPLVNQASFMWNQTGFWGHNDWDMMEVGNGRLSLEENRSHFALWCALKSPLIIGARLDSIPAAVVDVMANKELIAFNQDPVYGASARPYKWGYNKDGTSDASHPAEYWVGSSVQGIHLFLLNTRSAALNMTTTVAEIPGLNAAAAANTTTQFLLHDMWTGRDIGTFTSEININVKSHDTAALRITTLDGKHPNAHWTVLHD